MLQVPRFWNSWIDIEDYYQIARDTFEALAAVLKRLLYRTEDYVKNTVEHLILALILYISICMILYIAITRWNLFTFNREMRKAKRILFITAHPDDEVMFFGPTILHYVQKPDCNVYLLCLSSGKNYGMDKVRTSELYKSCKTLGIKEGNVMVVNHSSLPDAANVRWPVEVVSNEISHFVDQLDITNIVTFDRYGVSGHTNHCSIYYAVANLIVDGKLPKNCGVFVLESVNIIRKYWLMLDLPLSLILSRFRYMKGFCQRRIIQRAMCKHKSQYVWFRKVYMIISRYTLINTLQQVNMVDIELDLEIDD